MKKYLALGCILFLTVSQVASAAFVDVPDDHPYKEAIEWMEANGIVEGYDDGTYRPEEQINRAEFTKIIVEALVDIDQGCIPSRTFTDVSDDDWFAVYVCFAVELGLVGGYPDGSFKPANPINIAEALKIIMNAYFDVEMLYVGDLGYCYDEIKAYPTVDSNAWYWIPVYLADQFCIIPEPMILDMTGPDIEPIFDPALDLTRGEMAELIFRAKAVIDSVVDGNYAPYEW